jgi:hypothetical protein
MGNTSKKPVRQQIIQGMNLATLFKVLARNHFRVDVQCFGRLGYLVAMGVLNQVYGACEELVNARKIAATRIFHPPLFVIGHWRSGTTHLHNLLSLDDSFASPSAYQAFFPQHFVLTQPAATIFDVFAPNKRPMDNVIFGSDVPQEDEFAVAALSGVSPYLRVLFPVTSDLGYSELDPEGLPKDALEMWKESLTLFLKKVTFLTDKRIVLKSPPHMARMRILLEMFPGAKFLHIVRNPYIVYTSTHGLWRELLSSAHLQVPRAQVIDELILTWYTELFRLYERDRPHVPNGSLHELKYEDLEADPVESLRAAYRALGLPHFELFQDKVTRYLERIRGYRKNVHVLDDSARAKVANRWKGTFDRYGYRR